MSFVDINNTTSFSTLSSLTNNKERERHTHSGWLENIKATASQRQHWAHETTDNVYQIHKQSNTSNVSYIPKNNQTTSALSLSLCLCILSFEI
jgi:hypothetical protein